MRLKTLTLCLFGLSLSACSTYSIQSQSRTDASLDQKATTGLNAIYAYPSYDFNGRIKLSLDVDPNVKPEVAAKKLDQKLEQQVEAYLKTQNIQLTKQQKQAFYTTISEQQSSSNPLVKRDVFQIMSGVLEPIQLSYDGSVHYRQKLAALNLHYKYETPNAKSEMTAPMILDFQNDKFYFNIAGFIPYLLTKENRDRFVYFDFSKYKDDINKVDLDNVVQYLKQSTAVPYALADAKQLQQVALNSQDKANQVVEKVRLTFTLEEMVLQQFLYANVNQNFLKTSILKDTKEDQSKDDAKAIESTATEVEEDDDYYGYGLTGEALAAHKSSSKLRDLVDTHLYSTQDADEVEGLDEEDLADIEAQVDAEDVAQSDEDEVDVAATEASGLSEEQCEALAEKPKTAKMGDISYCQSEFSVDVLAADEKQDERPELKTATAALLSLAELSEVFKPDASDDFVDAQGFKTLWVKHADEINAALAKQKTNPITVDVGLDAQGRARTIDYGIDYHIEDLGRIKFKTDMNIINYGKATAIPQSTLKNAVTFKEMLKGSAFEQLWDTLDLDKTEGKTTELPKKSFDEQLEDVAQQVYAKTQSYSKTYQAVYIMQLTQDQPKVVQHYSAKQLSEIARVYAYSFADQSIYNPKGKELAELERLIEVHHLQDRTQYDYSLGDSVYDVVEAAIEQYKQNQVWLGLVKQYKQPKAVFAQYYVQLFLEEQELSKAEQVQLKATAEILAQAYLDSRQNKLSEKSVASLQADAEDYIDYSIYRKVFEKTAKHLK